MKLKPVILAAAFCGTLARPGTGSAQQIMAKSQVVQLVPPVIGLPVDSARRLLAARADLKATIRDSAVSGIRTGIVLDQNPEPRSPIPSNRTVLLIVSSSPPRSTQPERPRVDILGTIAEILRNRPRREPTPPDTARHTLPAQPAAPTPAAGDNPPPAVIAPPPETPRETVPPDTARSVASPTPAARPTGSVSSTRNILVPSLVRQPIATAAQTLLIAGLATDAREIARDSAGGFVLGQQPAAGTSVPPGTLVRLVRGVRVPFVEGMLLDSARLLVRAAELAALPDSGASIPSTVIDQRPPPGEVVTPGTIVELEAVRPRRSISPALFAAALLLLLLLVTGVGTALRTRQRLRIHARPPVIRPEAHQDPGTHKVTTPRELVGKTEIRLAARPGNVSSSVAGDGGIVAEDSDG